MKNYDENDKIHKNREKLFGGIKLLVLIDMKEMIEVYSILDMAIISNLFFFGWMLEIYYHMYKL